MPDLQVSGAEMVGDVEVLVIGTQHTATDDMIRVIGKILGSGNVGLADLKALRLSLEDWRRREAEAGGPGSLNDPTHPNAVKRRRQREGSFS